MEDAKRRIPDIVLAIIPGNAGIPAGIAAPKALRKRIN
jgi:hypothetical protein